MQDFRKLGKGMEIIFKGVFWSIAACEETFLPEDCIEIKNKEWKAGEKPEEKSLRSTLTYFKGDYFLKKDKACGEFYGNAMGL